jgi:short-subunit dehydrogenase
VERSFALVTGADSGIGQQLARVLSERGFDVFAASESDYDLATPDGVEALHARLDRPVDVLALNAGVSEGGEFAGSDLQSQLDLIDLNVRGTVHLAGLVTPEMVARRSGRVLLTSSMVATMPGPFQATYNASKSFIQSFGLALREELRPHGVSVTVLMPGPTATGIFARAGQLDTRLGASSHKADPADVAEQAVDALFAGRERVVAASMPLRVATFVSGWLPDVVKARLNAFVTRPGEAEPPGRVDG